MRIVAVEVADVVGKSAPDGRLQLACQRTRPIQRPLLEIRVEQAKGCPGVALGREGDLINVAHAVENLAAVRLAFEFLPVGTADKPTYEPSVGNRPCANEKVKVTDACSRHADSTSSAGRRSNRLWARRVPTIVSRGYPESCSSATPTCQLRHGLEPHVHWAPADDHADGSGRSRM